MGGKRKKLIQTVRMFPIGALAPSILETLGGVNYLEAGEDEGDRDSMYRDKVLLRPKGTPQRVILLNGRSFLARYKKVS